MQDKSLPYLTNRNYDERKNFDLIDHSLSNYLKSFPSEQDFKKFFPNSFVINTPLCDVGGDGYWAYKDEQSTYLVVFDCMGHGRLASIMTRKYISLVDRIIKFDHLAEPGTILTRIHKAVQSEFSGLEAKVSSGADMAVVK